MATDWGAVWQEESEEAAERYAMTYGEGGISQSKAARIAAEILADPAAPTSSTPEGPRRNRHLDGDGYGRGR